jgi:hypothetical protein
VESVTDREHVTGSMIGVRGERDQWREDTLLFVIPAKAETQRRCLASD